MQNNSSRDDFSPLTTVATEKTPFRALVTWLLDLAFACIVFARECTWCFLNLAIRKAN